MVFLHISSTDCNTTSVGPRDVTVTGLQEPVYTRRGEVKILLDTDIPRLKCPLVLSMTILVDMVELLAHASSVSGLGLTHLHILLCENARFASRTRFPEPVHLA